MPAGGVDSRVDVEWVKNVYQSLGDDSVKRFGRYVLLNDVVALGVLRDCGVPELVVLASEHYAAMKVAVSIARICGDISPCVFNNGLVSTNI